MEPPRKRDIDSLVHAVREDWKIFVAAKMSDHVLRVSILRRNIR